MFDEQNAHGLFILFAGTGKSTRSMLAEPILNRVKQLVRAFSAGSDQKRKVHPYVLDFSEKLHKSRSPDTIGRSVTLHAGAASFISPLTNAGTAADGADADLPPQSALENNGTVGWTTRADA